MIDIISIPDLVGGVRDICDRLRAPTRLAGHTRYVLRRHNYHRTLADPSVSSSSTWEREASGGDAVEELIGKEHVLLPGSRSTQIEAAYVSAVRELSRRAVVALRRDEFRELIDDAYREQNAEGIDSIMSSQVGLRRAVDRIYLSVRLKPCDDLDNAAVLFSSPLVELHELPERDRSSYEKISSPNGHPIFPIAHSAQELFADDYSERRFAILRSVTAALATAANHGWFHRHLDFEDIFVRSDLRFQPLNNDDTRPYAKILHFMNHLRLGCVNICKSCQADVRRRRVRGELPQQGFHDPFANLQNHTSPDEQNDLNRAWLAFSVDNGAYADVCALGAFVVWLYSGQRVAPYDNLLEDRFADVLTCVPWPLRFLILDRSHLSMGAILIFLDALQAGEIQPHKHTHDLFSFKNRNENVMRVLQDITIRSVLAGARTEEPQAALHLAAMWEHHTEAYRAEVTSTPDQTKSISENMLRTYFCFQCAGQFGDPEGYFNMARLQAMWIEDPQLLGQGATQVEDISYKSMLHLLLAAGVTGHTGAISALQCAAKNGIGRPLKLFSCQLSVLDAGDDDDVLLATVTKLGSLWRRGAGGFQRELEMAHSWLIAMHDRGYAPATLEYALLTRQRAETKADMCKAVRLAEMASVREQRAHFFLGWWHWYGVKINTKVILEKHGDLAKQHFRKAAEVWEPDGMAMYARVLRSGGKNPNADGEATQWLARAVNAGSVIGACDQSIISKRKARDLYQQTHPMTNLPTDDLVKCLEDSLILLQRCSNGLPILSKAVDTDLDTRAAETCLDPAPYWLAGKLEVEFAATWAACVGRDDYHCKGLQEEKIRLAESWLRQTVAFRHDVRWHRWRVDFRDYDIDIIRKAERDLSKLSNNGRVLESLESSYSGLH